MKSLDLGRWFLLSALALGSTVACGGGTSVSAPDPGTTAGAAGAGAAASIGGAAGAASTGGTGGAAGSTAAGGAAGSAAAGAGGAAGTGGVAGSGGSGGAPNPNALRIENFACTYAVNGATTLVDDMPIQCDFDVLGDPSRQVTLGCEDTQGNPIDCSASSPMRQAVPFGPQPIPLQRAELLDWAKGLAGTTYSVVVVATDGVETTRHTVNIPIVADDGINVAPTIDVDCGGNGSGQVDVTAGETASCHVVYYDPDPGTFDYSVARTAGVDPVNYVSTESGSAYTSRELDLVWKTDASEAGTSATYELVADDSIAPAVKKSIVINVK